MNVAPKLDKAKNNGIEIEQYVLGSLLERPERYDLVDGTLQVHHFNEPLHQRIFEIFLQEYSAGRLATPVALLQRLGTDEALQKVGGNDYLIGMISAVPIGDQIEHYTTALIDGFLRRRLSEFGSHVMHASIEAETGESALEELTAELTNIGQDKALQDSFESLYDAAGVGIKEAVSGQDGARPRGTKTGWGAYDQKIGGLYPGNYSILAGRPSMGKTAVALSAAYNIAKSGAGVAIHSLEMEAQECADRLLSTIAYDQNIRVPYTNLLRGTVDMLDQDALEMARQEMLDVPLYIMDQSRQSIEQIKSRTRRLKRRLESQGQSLDVVVIDHLGLIRSSDRYKGNKVGETGEISAELKGLAKDLDIHVMALCQLNREVEKRDRKRPMMSDLRWSGEIEQDADLITLVFREAYYLRHEIDNTKDKTKEMEIRAELEAKEHNLEMIVGKNRNGPTGSAHLFIDIAYNAIVAEKEKIRGY